MFGSQTVSPIILTWNFPSSSLTFRRMSGQYNRSASFADLNTAVLLVRGKIIVLLFVHHGADISRFHRQTHPPACLVPQCVHRLFFPKVLELIIALVFQYCVWALCRRRQGNPRPTPLHFVNCLPLPSPHSTLTAFSQQRWRHTN